MLRCGAIRHESQLDETISSDDRDNRPGLSEAPEPSRGVGCGRERLWLPYVGPLDANSCIHLIRSLRMSLLAFSVKYHNTFEAASAHLPLHLPAMDVSVY